MSTAEVKNPLPKQFVLKSNNEWKCSHCCVSNSSFIVVCHNCQKVNLNLCHARSLVHNEAMNKKLQWSCTKCTYTNGGIAIRCDVCYCKNVNGIELWDCYRCNSLNTISQHFCTICNYSKLENDSVSMVTNINLSTFLNIDKSMLQDF